MLAYQIALERCSTEWAPWFVVPADRKWYRNAVVARIVRRTLEALDLTYPADMPGLDKVSMSRCGHPAALTSLRFSRAAAEAAGEDRKRAGKDERIADQPQPHRLRASLDVRAPWTTHPSRQTGRRRGPSGRARARREAACRGDQQHPGDDGLITGDLDERE